MFLLILFAFIGGVVTLLSPCILPILPIILTGSMTKGKSRSYGIVLGFILSFTIFTLFLTYLVNLTGLSADFLRSLAVVILILSGLSLVWSKAQLFIEKMFTKVASRAPRTAESKGFWGGMIIGFSLGLVWTPCVGPILASVISLALTESVTGTAAIITLAYAAGTALPMLGIIFGGRQLLQKVPWLVNNTAKIQKAFGVLMIIVALAISLNLDRQFQTYILEKFPNYGSGLTSIEDNDMVQKELDKLQNNEINREDMGKSMFELQNKSQAPELIAGGEWFNSKPLTLNELKGKVVLLDIWTYSCINCLRTLPYIESWYEKYKDQGLVVIGIHAPEFEFEKNPDNVAKAIKDNGITYPVMQDNNYATWQAYQNRYWPRKYLIDYSGNIIYDHAGEGGYQETEKKIQEALKERNAALKASEKINDDLVSLPNSAIMGIFTQRSPEIYFGASRNAYLGNGQSNQTGLQALSEPTGIRSNILYLAGEWNIQDEYAQNQSEQAKIIFRYQAKAVYIVASADSEVTVKIMKDGKELTETEAGIDVSLPESKAIIKADRLYRLIEDAEDGEHMLEIIVENPGLRAFTFTFG